MFHASTALLYEHLERATAGLRAELRRQPLAADAYEMPVWDTFEATGPTAFMDFDGKHALYDALFERGWQALTEAAHAAEARMDGTDPVTDFRTGVEVFVRWAVEHPAYSALMLWRPVPGFVPSERAYAPAVAYEQEGRAEVARLRDRGVLRSGVDVDRALRTLTAVTGGVISQQLSNAPNEPFESGTFTSALPDVVDMWLAHYGAGSLQH